MSSRIKSTFDVNRTINSEDRNGLLSIYIPAGYPYHEATMDVILALDESGADMIELGMPYSDPLADGPTIQASSARSLRDGMTLDVLFTQLTDLRKYTQIPILLMGYYNQLVQYGMERFMHRCVDHGIDGVILPDLPLDYYEENYQSSFEQMRLGISFLITPDTSPERRAKAAALSSAFLYIVSSASITGTIQDINKAQNNYFASVKSQFPETRSLIGFGIHDTATFTNACRYADGAIIGSSFVRALQTARKENIAEIVHSFVDGLRS